MLKEVVIHYSSDEKALEQISKDLIAFYSAAAVKYIKRLNLNNKQIETLYDRLSEDIAEKQRLEDVSHGSV